MSVWGRLINKLRGTMDIESLVTNGLTIGKDVFINFECIIDESFCWLVEIGDRVVLAPRVHILAHDASTKKALGFTKVGRVKIGNDVFIGASSIILPGVCIGNKVVVGAGSVVSRDIPSNSVAIGSPAKVVCSYDEYMDKNKEIMKESVVFDASYTINGGITKEKKNLMKSALSDYKKEFIV